MSEAHAPPREKDRWDKANIIGQVLVPVMLAALTGVYSYQENAHKHAEALENAALQRDNATAAKANAVAAFMPYVRGNTDSAQVKIVSAALASLGYEDFALTLATRAASVPALEALATTADRAATRDSAVAVLVGISGATTAAADSTPTRLALLADSALLRVQVNESKPAGDESAIVTGGYGNVKQAQMDADAIRAGGFPAVAYLRNGVARTAIRFPTRQDARLALPEIRTRVRRSAYIVDWRKWCPDPAEMDGHVRCAPSLPETRES